MMVKTPENRKPKNEDEDRKSKKEEDRQLSRELEESFPPAIRRQLPSPEAALLGQRSQSGNRSNVAPRFASTSSV
jgi:hypothetical protein